MVYYSIDTKIRRTVIFYLAILSIGLISVLNKFIPSNLNPPSVMGMFGLFYWFFNSHLWKIKYINMLLGIPDLNGEWKGVLNRTDHKQQVNEEFEVNLTINQNFTKISLILENNNPDTISGRTRSFSEVVGLSIENKNCIILRDIFEYEKAKGCSELRLHKISGKRFLKGTYVSSALRYGHLDLHQIK